LPAPRAQPLGGCYHNETHHIVHRAPQGAVSFWESTLNRFVWSHEFEVGLKDIDDQHRRLFELAASFDEAVRSGQAQGKIDATLAQLIDYIKQHFAFEERELKERGFTDLAEHARNHVALTKQVVDYVKSLRTGQGVVAGEVNKLLHLWLMTHVKQHDIGAFAAVGVRATPPTVAVPAPTPVPKPKAKDPEKEEAAIVFEDVG
jgi:hemerythrin-like metal-binding protein